MMKKTLLTILIFLSSGIAVADGINKASNPWKEVASNTALDPFASDLSFDDLNKTEMEAQAVTAELQAVTAEHQAVTAELQAVTAEHQAVTAEHQAVSQKLDSTKQKVKFTTNIIAWN